MAVPQPGESKAFTARRPDSLRLSCPVLSRVPSLQLPRLLSGESEIIYHLAKIGSCKFSNQGSLSMRTRYFLLVLLLACILGIAGITRSQDSSNPAGRKVVRRTMPVYPAMAKKMNLSGTVKIFAVVAPDGSVKTTQPMGGSPLLIQAAQEAISTWKFAPASSESKELIELHFNPN